MAAMVLETLRRLARLVEQGQTWRAAAAACDVPLSSAYLAVTSKWPRLRRRRRPRLTDTERADIIAEINAGELSYRQIARRWQRSADTVVRLARQQIEAYCADLEFRPPSRARKSRCPGCGAPILTRGCLRCLVVSEHRTRIDGGHSNASAHE